MEEVVSDHLRNSSLARGRDIAVRWVIAALIADSPNPAVIYADNYSSRFINNTNGNAPALIDYHDVASSIW